MIRDIFVSKATMRVTLEVPVQAGIPNSGTVTIDLAEDALREQNLMWPEIVRQMTEEALDAFFSKLTELKAVEIGREFCQQHAEAMKQLSCE